MPFGNPWKTVKSRIVYKNPWISVREDEVIQPNGTPGIYGVLDTRIANGVVALTPEREVYLVGQYRYPNDVYSWEIIEGGTDEGEEPLECAKRELKEEAGLIAQTWHLLGHEIHMSNCVTSEVGYLFIAEDLMETESDPDDTEILQIRKVPFTDAIAMVESGEIVDAFTIIGLLLAERWLAKNG
ncbi:MAG: NUDIX hydrolase [Candidatus Hydrogenedentota bacterium]